MGQGPGFHVGAGWCWELRASGAAGSHWAQPGALSLRPSGNSAHPAEGPLGLTRRCTREGGPGWPPPWPFCRPQ